MGLTEHTDDRFAADLGATASWPSQIVAWADVFEQHDPTFNRKRFIERATAAWEENYDAPEIDDYIPY